MDRKKTIKILREIIHTLKDVDIFSDLDFEPEKVSDDQDLYVESRVKQFIIRKLDL